MSDFNWLTLYAHLSHWAKSEGPDLGFEQLQRAQIVQIKLETALAKAHAPGQNSTARLKNCLRVIGKPHEAWNTKLNLVTAGAPTT
ncbi:hypothetical protein [Variovorax sp. EBFNA2]|uniref:hypothetical protein n=1 Tax=Variovorax sp. EBFNA2 TaxID=3342097 RepID=UPI0029C00CCE|nr:hypothetical protein [Variovorax boronicumulans]WPG41596.1 hypothetical protein RZE79_32345 [Variovorax boronicumulans]